MREAAHPNGPHGDARFSTTHWSLVLEAQGRNSKAADEALEDLCKAYWYPLYSYARRSGLSAEMAQDLTQDYFHLLLEKRILDTVHPSKGKFRSFLLASFKNVINSEFRRSGAQKRGGGQTVLSIDEQDPEGRYKREPQDDVTPEQLYEKRWAQTLIGRAIQALKEEWETQGKPFEKLKVYLIGEKGSVPFNEMAAELQTSETALKVTVHRMRKRYAELFKREVALTVADPAEVDEEMRHLLAALGS